MRLPAVLSLVAIVTTLTLAAPSKHQPANILEIVWDDEIVPALIPIFGMECTDQLTRTVWTTIKDCNVSQKALGDLVVEASTTMVYDKQIVSDLESKLNMIVINFNGQLCKNATCYNGIKDEYIMLYKKCPKLIHSYMSEFAGLDQSAYNATITRLLMPATNPLCMHDPTTNNYCGVQIVEDIEKLWTPMIWNSSYHVDRRDFICTRQVTFALLSSNTSVVSLGNQTITNSYNQKCPNTTAANH
ncbi:uncharacterized protein BJ171DRAFT_566309 [Polychytrium aggregatum]|uniref:uncharacterized protein n=1 Tax=Polychytrium aggregatum TaxID=110093 RepID=UPI0022FEEFF3|nr:uncharacterized protein BJ171DRAFT_566309 [Polychytrium aggregatum]KAI9206941.1 hypothetical protein BJ171DRAFT_566309 [Polychytrium aggregatum]